MDAQHSDQLTRRLKTLVSRRIALAGLLALPLPLDAVSRGKNKNTNRNERKRRRKARARKRNRAQAQPEACWRAGICVPRKGANLSRCDVENSTAFIGLDCTGCNVSRANLRAVNARDANFTRANLSGSCLVNADFTGAIFASNTNLANAIFCNTTMPDGSINDSGCESGTACCPTGCRSNADCETGQICHERVCQPCDVCTSNCAFSSIQAAVDATSPQRTIIRICPGTYIEPGSVAAVDIHRSLTMIGAGDGGDPANNTVIRPASSNSNVLRVLDAGTVHLEGLRVTGGSGENGRGVNIVNSIVTMANCTSTENHPTLGTGGGAQVFRNAQLILINSHIVKNSEPTVGGVDVDLASTLTLDALSRVTGNASSFVGGIRSISNSTVNLASEENVTGNTPNNCLGEGFAGPGAICAEG